MRGVWQVGAAFQRLCAIVGPIMLGALTMLYTSRPSSWFLVAAGTLAIAILACDAWIIVGRRWLTGGLALFIQTGFLLFVAGYTSAPFPAAAPLSGSPPQASPPAGMAVSYRGQSSHLGICIPWRLTLEEMGVGVERDTCPTSARRCVDRCGSWQVHQGTVFHYARTVSTRDRPGAITASRR